MANTFGALVWQGWPATLPIRTPYPQTLRGQRGVDHEKQAEGVGWS